MAFQPATSRLRPLDMANPSDLLRALSEDRFVAVMAASPRKVREEIFRRAGIKNRGGSTFALKPNAKSEVRIKRLRAWLLQGQEIQVELAEELVRNYLYTRRSLLAEALDFLEVEHDEGLTDADLDFVQELPAERATHLRDLLARSHDAEDVALYLGFMSVPATGSQ